MSKPNATAEKFDAYTAVFNAIITQLDNGVIPWRKSWTAALPHNAVSKKTYRGINPWLLMAAGFSDPRWLTWNQCQDLGGTVKKDQAKKYTMVVFWNWVESKTEVDAMGRPKKIPFLRYFRVYNVEQCDGLDLKTLGRPDAETITTAEDVLAGYTDAPKIKTGSRPCYSNSADTVTIPGIESFDDDAEYYVNLFHELAHSTGHKSRLDRKSMVNHDGFGGTVYSEEELVAEFAAAFLCHAAQVPNDLPNSAAYIASWSKFLKDTDNKKVLVHAAAAAQKAADYILGQKTQDESPTTESKDLVPA